MNRNPHASLGVRLHAVWKCVRVLGHILSGLLTIARVFPALDDADKEARIQGWALAMLSHLGIKLVVHGPLPARGPLLLAANHISWLDIVVLHATRHCRFVSKAELRHWPLIGALAAGAGTLFIERESRRDALRVVHHMAERLVAGDILAIFPEGTTSNGQDLLPFHANLFQAAIVANAPVLPVALRFEDARTGQHSLAPCYIGDDTLVGSIWRTVTAPPLCAVVSLGEAQYFRGRTRRDWAADVRLAVAALRSA